MRRKRNCAAASYAGMMIAVCVGCADEKPIALVSGVITFEGEPLVGASITTQPMATAGNSNPGSGSFGETDEQGRYSLELVEPAVQGAIVGTHRVIIVREQGEEDPTIDLPTVTVDRSWPTRFTDGSLRLEVPAEGTDKADFDLKRGRAAG